MEAIQEGVIENYCYMPSFGSPKRKIENADIAVIGIPFEGTVTCRPGTRYGPRSIRGVLGNFWTYNLYLGFDPFEVLKIVDYGDLEVIHGNLEATVSRIEKAISEILLSKTMPCVLGGEHTISYPVVKAIGDGIGVIQFDAHMDLMDTYQGQKLSHATALRRICEIVDPKNVVQIGIRTASHEEHSYAKDAGMTYYTPLDVEKRGMDSIMLDVLSSMEHLRGIYVTIDIDAFDPCYAPGTGCHEPDGLSTREMITAIHLLNGSKIVGMDLVEVSPAGRFDPTPSVAAKLIVEAFSVIGRDKAMK